MRRRLGVAGVLAIAAAVGAPAASAADQTVQAVDGTAADNFNNRWSPRDVTVKSGEKVTWSFAGTAAAHNVQSETSNWSFHTDIGVAKPPAIFTFATPGTYGFVCQVHPDTMKGTVTVTDAGGNPPPPPPPPPLSEQPFPNDSPPPTVLEITDEQRPSLTRVRISRVARGARVRFRLSEPARVTIRFKRGRKTVKTRRVDARKGTRTVTVRGLRAGRYRVEVRARDLAGNQSRLKRARLSVR
jgi:plastocyanin